MLPFSRLGFALLVLTLPVFAQTPPAFPETPAGRTLSAFLDAFNSADSARLTSLIQTYGLQDSPEQLVGFSHQTGGFTLLSIIESQPDSIRFRVLGRGDHKEALGSMLLSSINPPKMLDWSIRLIPPGAAIEKLAPLDAAARKRTIDAIAKQLTDFYVYPEGATKMVSALRWHEKHGAYDALTDGNAFAHALLRDLLEVSHDRHLRVDFSPFRAPPGDDPSRAPNAEETARYRADTERENCAFTKVEILPQNIGYLKLDAFEDPSICGPTVNAAMGFVAHVDALILDLRENHGGDPVMVDLVASYLFSEPTHLNDIYDRAANETNQFWTLPYLPGPRITAPVYVLTSNHTFSGGEELSYDLQTQKRATLVGETTGGGAHPVRPVPAGEHFTLGVPYARPINPVTKKDWEGTGVEPEVKVAAADALATAQKLAAEKLQAR